MNNSGLTTSCPMIGTLAALCLRCWKFPSMHTITWGSSSWASGPRDTKGPKHRGQFAANWEAGSILSTSNSFSRSRVIIFLYAAMAELRGLRQRRGFYISCEWDGTLARGPVTCIGYWPGWILSKSLGDCIHQESRQGLEQRVVWLLNSTSTLYGACVTTSGWMQFEERQAMLQYNPF